MERFHFWFSQKAKERIMSEVERPAWIERNLYNPDLFEIVDWGHRRNVPKCHLDDGEVREYTEASKNDAPISVWDDQVYLGMGVIEGS